MDLFGDGFDDDLFSEGKSQKVDINRPETTWIPHMYEPEWFKSVPAGNTILSDSVNVKHFHANHLYFTGKYLEASQIFSDVFDMVPPGNSQLKREVAEGLARSLMKAGKIEHALDAAEMFKLSCKSKMHVASCHMLYADIFRASLNHESELKQLQLAVMYHQLNADIWLKLAECYSLLSGVSIYSPSFQLSPSCGRDWFSAASLIRASVIIRSVAGKADHLKKKKCDKLQNQLLGIIGTIPEVFVAKAREALCRDVFNIDNQRAANEFVDLGSSSNNKATEEEETDPVAITDREDWFENHWFQFMESIREEDSVLHTR